MGDLVSSVKPALFVVGVCLTWFACFSTVALIEKLKAPGKYPGCSGSRNLHDNLSDLKAQVAANHKVRS